MDLDRRHFLKASSATALAALADELFGFSELHAKTTQATPSPALATLADVALGQAKKLGASYADIRINRYRDQTIALRSTPEPGTGKINHVPTLRETGEILAQAARTLDFTQPVALMMLGIVGQVSDSDQPESIIKQLLDALPPGRLERYVMYWNAKGRREREEMERSRSS